MMTFDLDLYDLDFENRVSSVTFSVLDRLFPYLPQIITTIRGCVACKVDNKILKFLDLGSKIDLGSDMNQ